MKDLYNQSLKTLNDKQIKVKTIFRFHLITVRMVKSQSSNPYHADLDVHMEFSDCRVQAGSSSMEIIVGVSQKAEKSDNRIQLYYIQRSLSPPT